MKILNLIQGSPEWDAHRAEHFNASDSPVMMGVSPYKTLDQLLSELATGLTKEVDPHTQRLFDDGHKFEALSRPVAEKIIGEELYPVVGVDGKFSASFDGITMDETIIFEHKTLNDTLRKCDFEDGYYLPDLYKIQMEHQLMVSGATKCLFMASTWSADVNTGEYELHEERHTWYYPDLKLRQRIIDGWAQFEKDLMAYVPPAVKEKVIAEEVQSFPVPSIQVRGELVNCNLSTITPVFDKYLAETNTDLVTDQDFADGEANAKNCREAAKNLKLTAKAVIGQITEINEAVSTLEQYAAKFDAMGLKLEKAVKEQKESIKTNAILKAKQDFFARVQSLEAEIKPIRLVVETPNFADAIKGLKTIDSMHAKINQALTNGYINADSVARDIRNKLEWFRSVVTEPLSLFSDLDNIIYKPMDDFKLVVETRIAQQKERDAKRDAELKAKIEAEKINEAKPEVIKSESATAQDQVDENKSSLTLNILKKAQPSAIEIVDLVAKHYMVSKEIASDWLAQTDFQHMRKVA